jgi:hypothetical protein
LLKELPILLSAWHSEAAEITGAKGMHHEFNAFLLLFLICASSLIAVVPHSVNAAPPEVRFGIRVWNYNATHVVPGATVSVFNKTKTVTPASGDSNQTGWSNFTGFDYVLGTYTMQIKFQNVVVYNNTLDVNQTTIYRAVNTNVTDHAFIFADNLSRHVEKVTVDIHLNSSIISSAISAANGTAVVKNLPFHNYNVTASREGVSVSNSTLKVNATTYGLNSFVMVHTYNYTLSVRDYMGQNIVSSGTVGIYDWEVSTNNGTKPLSAQVAFMNFWPGIYVIVVTSSNAVIWDSSVILSENTTQLVNSHVGYSVTLHVFDALNRPIPSVSVNLIQNGVVIATVATDSSGIATFSNLPESLFQLNFTVLHRAYTTSANITGASVDMSIKLDDIIILAGAPFNTAPIEASLALILTVAAILGTILLYRWRRSFSGSNAAKSKEVGE